MNTRESAIFQILKQSARLFRDNGFEATSVRQIAEEAGTSASMINHYFGSKDYLGAQVLSLLASYAHSAAQPYVSPEKDPILYDLTISRMLFSYLFTNGYLKFYQDSLKSDFFFRFLDSKPTRLAEELSKFYSFEYTPDEATLYCRYMPYMLEKTLILKKAEGMFTSLDYFRIPCMISTMGMSHFIPEEEILLRDPEARQICAQVLPSLHALVPDSWIAEYVSQTVLPN